MKLFASDGDYGFENIGDGKDIKALQKIAEEHYRSIELGGDDTLECITNDGRFIIVEQSVNSKVTKA